MRQESNHRISSGDKESPRISNSRAMGVIILIVLLFVFQVAAFVVQKVRIAALEREGAVAEMGAVSGVSSGVSSGSTAGHASGFVSGSTAGHASGSVSASALGHAARGELFPFDPNDISLDSLQLLGFSRRQAQTIINYRNKGGKFRQKKDFAKMYVVDSAKYHSLAPYILLPDRYPAGDRTLVPKKGNSGTKPAGEETLVPKKGNSGTKPAGEETLVPKRGISGTKPAREDTLVPKRGNSGTKPAGEETLVPKRGISGTKSVREDTLVPKRGNSGTKPVREENTLYGTKVERNRYVCNLNTADSAALVRLYGIGGYYARKILRYRELLGGSFVSPRQLLEIEGFTQERNSAIEMSIFVNQEDIIGFSLLKADRKSLEQHPYIGPYAARGIVTYLRIRGAQGASSSGTGSAVSNLPASGTGSAAIKDPFATASGTAISTGSAPAVSVQAEQELILLKELVKERILTPENARKLEEYLLHL